MSLFDHREGIDASLLFFFLILVLLFCSPSIFGLGREDDFCCDRD